MFEFINVGGKLLSQALPRSMSHPAEFLLNFYQVDYYCIFDTFTQNIVLHVLTRIGCGK